MSRIRVSDEECISPPDMPDNAIRSVFQVAPEQAGQRVDVFLRHELRRTSRTRAQKIIRMSAYDEQGRRVRPGERVRAKQKITLWRPPWDESEVPTDIPILYEDQHLLAVNKPAHLPVHPTARYHHNTLIKLLQVSRPGQYLVLAHRLDRETSGVILVAKTPTCDRLLKRQFERRQGLEKEYVAFTCGIPQWEPKEAIFRCEKKMELDPASLSKVKMHISEGSSALSATTCFLLQEIAQGPQGKRYAKVQCLLESGRQHQIRLHLASLGAFIVGDKLYGLDETYFMRAADGELKEEDWEQLELPRHALHAIRFQGEHPITKKPFDIYAPLAEDMKVFWGKQTPLWKNPNGR
ncbi:pseudouridine synthase [Pajaroellobacter abortibovis]|uniref:Pseudouridine synthase RsuA/RluA-like domain-containing protein n=1 Tax=Pajaroellobacter abortibovis TaxID=1882918 RepID=A0A1L6MXC3_9BACT|nr:RluA family pseudouridine synthase [Pajaroellobacter abortibovis]APS00223.1 hypothetical protein BCY86_05660 [Pajaroellobacter abortibovis]